MKVAGDLGDLPAVELAFGGQHFRDCRFGNPGATRGLCLRDALCSITQQLRPNRQVAPA
jgi:hypothetical protein